MPQHQQEELLVTESCGKIHDTWKLEASSSTNQGLAIVSTSSSQKKNDSSSSYNNISSRILHSFESTFLPAGYPQSVTKDYLRYQVFDTLQALCSTVTGTLSTRAVLKGVGVGDATATALSGTVSWLLRDGFGMIGRIVFASVVSSDLDHDAKRWRLAADVTNDIGLFINILSGHVDREYFIYLGCVASLFFAVTGVAGGATRTALTRHFSVSGFSTADIAACEGSQETAVNFIGMWFGMLVTYLCPQTFTASLCVVAFFTFLHLLTNYLGVKSLILEYLNENRLVICLERRFSSSNKKNNNNNNLDRIPTPEEMKDLENVVLPNRRIANIKLGVSLKEALTTTVSKNSNDIHYQNLLQSAMQDLKTDGYFVAHSSDKENFYVVLSDENDDDELEEMKRIIRAYLKCVGIKLGNDSLIKKPQDFLDELKRRGWRTERFQLRVSDWRVKVSSTGEDKKRK